MCYGVGKYGLNKAFRFRDNKIISIDHIDDHTLEQLIGYERQKQKLIANTEAFINGKKANNVLLYGDDLSTTGVEIKVFAFFNGDDSSCTTANAVSLDAITLNITFTLANA